ncbi:MAG: hypothetical protein M3069_11290 [Chloroflexota bacterium]|nr:hypothetical protein [Chloroflexota bacterium]
MLQVVLAELPPDVAAQVVLLLDAGDVEGALMLAGVLPAAADDGTRVFEQVMLNADGTPSAGDPSGWEPILPLPIVPNAADPYATEITLQREQVQQFLSPVAGIDLSNRQADPWNVALSGLQLVLSAAGDAPSDCNDAFARVAQAVPQGPDAVRDALQKSRPGCNQSRSLIRLSGFLADGTPVDIAGEATLNQFLQQMTAMADGLGGSELGGRRVQALDEGGDGSATTRPPSDINPTAGVGTREQRLQELARDPAQGGKITPGSLQEARVAQGLEQAGVLPGPVRRDPTGGADFVDATGQDWDVKGFNSNFPLRQGGYDLGDSMSKIRDALASGENVILDSAKLSAAAIQELRAAVEAQPGWAGRVVWWP